MKKITLTLAIACLGISASVAQTQRTILYEEFTGENCPPCASTNPYVDMDINPSFPNKILLVRFQGNIPSAPGAGSLYADDPTEVTTRQTYYAVPFAPYARFNGIVLPDASGQGNDGHAIFIDPSYYPNIINDSAIVNAPFAISTDHVFNAAADSVTITTVITAAQAFNSSTLKLQVCLMEAAIHFATATGTNGEKDFYHVMRKMIPGVTGTALAASWTNAQTQTIVQKVKIPTYIHDKSQIEIVAFIESDNTGATDRRVHNAGHSAPKGVTLDASVSSIDNAVIVCSNTITPVATISNPGATTMTTCNIVYKLDATTALTYSWTGSLASGATQQVTLPNIVTTNGTHTLAINTSVPNGLTDQNAGNDKKTTKIIVESSATAAPIVEGFTVTTFPPTNWAVYNPDGGTYTWKRNTTAGGYGTSTNSAYIQFYNNAHDGDIDELYVAEADLTTGTNPQLKFDYAYNYYTDTNGDIYDSLDIQVSTDCGASWTSIFYDGGPTLTTAATPGLGTAYTPATTEWASQTLSLSAYATSNAVLIKFMGKNHYGNNLYLDNINIDVTMGVKSTKGNINYVRVFPNPAVNETNVKVSLAQSEKVTVTVYNTLGEQSFVQAYNLNSGDNNLTIPTDKLANGVYTVLVNSASGNYQTKLTVSK